MFKKSICILFAILLLTGCTTVEEVYSESEQTTAATTVTTTKATVTTVNTTAVTTTALPIIKKTVKKTARSKGTQTTAVSFDVDVMSFNVRYKDDANGHSIAERAPRVQATVTAHSPDIIGMQEVVPAWHQEITERFSDTYGILTHYRSDKNPEGHTILYKKAVFECIDEGFFWLSETPEKESKGWGATLPRIASWVLLRHLETGRQVLFFTYHGHGSDIFAQNSCDMIVKKMQEYPDAACILTGDFNRNDTSAGYRYFLQFFADARKTASGTGWSDEDGSCPVGYPNPNAPAEHGKVIDHIFYDAKQLLSLQTTIDTTRYDGYFSSDHYAVAATLRVKGK